MSESSSIITSSVTPMTRADVEGKKSYFEALQIRISKCLHTDPLLKDTPVEAEDRELARKVLRISKKDWLELGEEPRVLIDRANDALLGRITELKQRLAEMASTSTGSSSTESTSEKRDAASSSSVATERKEMSTEASSDRKRQLFIGLSLALVALSVFAVGTVAFNLKPPVKV